MPFSTVPQLQLDSLLKALETQRPSAAPLQSSGENQSGGGKPSAAAAETAAEQGSRPQSAAPAPATTSGETTRHRASDPGTKTFALGHRASAPGEDPDAATLRPSLRSVEEVASLVQAHLAAAHSGSTPPPTPPAGGGGGCGGGGSGGGELPAAAGPHAWILETPMVSAPAALSRPEPQGERSAAGASAAASAAAAADAKPEAGPLSSSAYAAPVSRGGSLAASDPGAGPGLTQQPARRTASDAAAEEAGGLLGSDLPQTQVEVGHIMAPALAGPQSTAVGGFRCALSQSDNIRLAAGSRAKAPVNVRRSLTRASGQFSVESRASPLPRGCSADVLPALKPTPSCHATPPYPPRNLVKRRLSRLSRFRQ